jgi:hypothetical protein
MTAVINQTSPLSLYDQPVISGTWLVTIDLKADEIFTVENQYTFFKREQTIISINIDDAVYFVNNVQQPIARQNEIVFRNILFTIVVLELFRLGFLLFKMVCIPLYRFFARYISKKEKKFEQIDDEKVSNEVNSTELNAVQVNEGELLSKMNLVLNKSMYTVF